MRPVDVEAGELLQQQGGVALSAKPGAIDVALMGSNGPGLTGRGTLVEVHFEVLSDGDPAIMIASAEARDKTNEGIEIGIGVTNRVAVPHTTRLLASVPNPFNATTTVQFELASREHVELSVYDVNGRLVRQLVAEMRGPGRYQVVWHGMDDRGRGVASGVYFVRLRAGDVMRKRALTVVK